MVPKRHAIWGGVLGFGLGGFFDGILLHQVLQWHHLVSLVPGLQDMRSLILWDGLFHVATYVITALGLWGLWRARRHEEATGRFLAVALLAGFGLWNVVDIGVFHWIIGIHRTRVDVAYPLFWDLFWLAMFGLAPIVLALALHRGDDGGRMGRATLASVTLITAAMGAISLLPAPNQQFTTVVFRPGLPPGAVIAALDAAEARLVWADERMGVVVVKGPASRRLSFYRNGALMVGGAGAPAGCLGWSRPRA